MSGFMKPPESGVREVFNLFGVFVELILLFLIDTQ